MLTSVTSREPLDAIAYATELPVICKVACASVLEKAFERLYGDGTDRTGRIVARFEGAQAEARAEDAERLKDLASDAPIVQLVNHWIEGAVEARASDIHVEPGENAVRVRYRLDGALRPVENLPPRFGPAVSSRIKIMARLDIAERR